MRNYVPHTLVSPEPCNLYPQNQVSRTLKTMCYVPQPQNYVRSTLDIMYFHNKFDKKVE